MEALVTNGLTKHYGHRDLPIHRPGQRPAGTIRALEDLSIAVHEGEIFGFLGPNGAGKSTTIRLLLGYLFPTAGSAAVFGLDVVRDSVEIRRRVGYLPGGIALYDSLTGERLLDYLGELTGRPPGRRQELLDRLELSARTLRRPVRDYSRGMRQKIGIVQALQHDPDLAILDEPTEGLDPLMQRAFYTILDDLRAAGRTIFFSSHVLSEVERVSDRVAIVRRGRLVALEDVDRLLERRKRNVELRVAGDPPRLENVPGVTNVRILPDGRITCQLDGDVGPFLAAIAGHRVTDLTIEPAHLEEAFLELYEDSEPDGDGEAGPEPGSAPPDASATNEPTTATPT
jgi:ABC-2 type transport system ATP-binding protein